MNKELVQRASSEFEELRSGLSKRIRNFVKDLNSENEKAQLYAIRSLEHLLNSFDEEKNGEKKRKKWANAILENIKMSQINEKILEVKRIKRKCEGILKN